MKDVNLVLSWIFGLFSLLIGILTLFSSFWAGACLFVISYLLLPPIRNLVYDITKIKIPKMIRTVLILFLFISFLVLINSSNDSYVVTKKEIRKHETVKTEKPPISDKDSLDNEDCLADLHTVDQAKKADSVLRQPSTIKKEFSFSVEQFIQRYNQACKVSNYDMNVVWQEEDESNTDYLYIVLTVNKNIAIGVDVNKKTRLVQAMTLLGKGDGSVQPGADLIVAPVFMIMAIEDPNMHEQKRSALLNSLNLQKVLKSPDEESIIFYRDDVAYSVGYSSVFGLTITAEPI